MIRKTIPYEVVFADGTFVIVPTLNGTVIGYAYERKYNTFPTARIVDYYNVPWYYNKVEE